MREEVRRLWLQALEDLETAKVMLETRRYYASAFFSHQAAEKALKALFIHLKREISPKTHNLLELLEGLNIVNEDVVDAAIELNPEYVVSRYPDAANGVPAQMYNERIAKERYEKALRIVGYCKGKLEEK
ncbi:MAG: HEPN domain-containing protein [Candidatus Bathyarchaeota archaeon]|nr:HEPN domain-containing protein [Candidatus Bathyarchaeota archaeon]